jgi:tetratricopeptide (TPR) repeat protein
VSFGAAVKWFIIYGFGIVALIGFAVWQVMRADDPARAAFKWVLTIIVLCFMIFFLGPFVGAANMASAFIGVPLTAVCGIILAILWRHEISDMVANPIASLYDGGNIPPEPKPAYSAAQAKQKTGHYQEAIEAIRHQLEMFPQDLEGYMLLASIQAEDLKDLPAAEETIMRFCDQPGHAPRALVYALYSLADWHLAVNRDAPAAQRALQRLIELVPDTEFALGAAQRIAHLGDPAAMDAEASRIIHLKQGVQDLGLRGHVPEAPPKHPEELAAEYVKHLEKHPMDTEIREKLAEIYVDHYKRLDLATAELEQLINTPKQAGRVVTRALSLLADLQKRSGEGYDVIKATLERIIKYDPRCAAAEIAGRRIELLKLELKAHELHDPVKMGQYEQDIGLKRSRSEH